MGCTTLASPMTHGLYNNLMTHDPWVYNPLTISLALDTQDCYYSFLPSVWKESKESLSVFLFFHFLPFD